MEVEFDLHAGAAQLSGVFEALVAEDVELADLDVGGREASSVDDACWGGVRRDVMSSGCVAEQRLPAGDVVVVGPRGEGGQLGVGCRVAIVEHRIDQELAHERRAASVACDEGDAGIECRDKVIEDAEHNIPEGKKAGLLVPYLRGINTDLMTPLAFALISGFAVEYWGISTLGFFTYMKKFVNFKSPIDFFIGILELISEFAKIISFSFRLFGNVFAGEVLLAIMAF